MAAQLLQARDRGQALLSKRGKLWNGEKSEFARCLSRIEQKPDVRGGHSGRLEQPLFLHVIRDEVVVARTSEFVEVAPNPQSVAQQESPVSAAQLLPFTR